MTGEVRGLRLTVRDLLEVPRFRLRLVAGAAGLDRPVRWAHSTELLDPSSYLRGNEVVLTVGASLSDPGRCVEFARAVSAGNASAIGYGIGDVTAQVPRALAEECERLGLPLLEVPQEVPFPSFTEWLAERLAATREERHDREEMGRLLGLVRDGLALPEALRDRVERAGLSGETLVAMAVPVRVLPEGVDAGVGGLLGFEDGTAVLVVDGEERAVTLAKTWSGPAGVGSPGRLKHLPRSISEACTALESARRSGGVVRAADLATFQVLLERLDPEWLTPFVDQIARPLADHDVAHSGRLVETLRAFLATGGSVGAASRSLDLHPNTLRHRLSRIEAITGRNPLSFEDRIALAVAMRAVPRS
ncbi:PucR C-terminal helix-turn-helix domain-containing protein [Thermomonospora echinospora]|uniref:PucR C-terminal helix-turn-helix domain-containing protein n=1 Tax=Thermomonospora echinospora TaxID=1992 RepID=A0A1H6BNR5_9ACTN|nr:PucR C-terminal helix-turn-helix domain-containing protein [Thermomonospora echinospora]